MFAALLASCSTATEPATSTITVENHTPYTAHVIIGNGDDIRAARRYTTATYHVPNEPVRVRVTWNTDYHDTTVTPPTTMTLR
jgi:hypothetical protein